MNTAIVKSALPFINLGFAWCDMCNTTIAPTVSARTFHERRCARLLKWPVEFANDHRDAARKQS